MQVLWIPVLMVAVVLLVGIATLGVDLTNVLLGGTHAAATVYGFAIVCTFLSLWLVLAGVFAYLNGGQQKKIEAITGFYSPDTIADYFEQFWSGRDGIRNLVRGYRAAVAALLAAVPADTNAARQAMDQAGAGLESKLQELFKDDFGLKVYIVPVVLLIATGAIVLFFGFTGGIGLAIARSSGGHSPVQPFGINLDLISIAAIFGAYTWIASDVIVRNQQWTLHPSDLGWYILRLIVAVPLGQALALTVGGANVTTTGAPTVGAGAFVAFVVSLFSLDAITNALATTATRLGVQMQSSSQERDDVVTTLAGVDEVRARALGVEGVTTIAQLVTVDPVRLSIRTGLAFEYILNLIDAALLWVFVRDKLKLLSPLGLRGASDVLALDEQWVTAFNTALTALRQADAAVAAAVQARDQAASALAAAQAQNPPPPLGPLQQDVTNTDAALTAAQQARLEALTGFLAAPGVPGPTVDHTAMIAALVAPSDKGGPGLQAIGFDTICERLRNDSYAVFVRRLLQ